MRRRRLITAAAAALLAGAIAAGVSYATIPGPGNVYSACLLKGIGTIRLIDKSLPASNLMSRCKPSLEMEVSWNQAGQQGPAGPTGAKGDPGVPGADGAAGADGASVTTAAEAAGGSCAEGGVQLTAANGVTYVCNGKNGADGTNGADGVSVTSAAETPGSNCAHGGSKFTAASGVTYACNGAAGTGGSGPPTVCNGVLGAHVHDVTGCSLLRVATSAARPDADNTTTGLTGGVAGQIVTVMLSCSPFCNIDQKGILADNGSLALAGDAVLFPGDTVQLIHAGSFWAELGRSDN